MDSGEQKLGMLFMLYVGMELLGLIEKISLGTRKKAKLLCNSTTAQE